MHFFAQIKPKSHIHIMWTSHLRKSALLDNVLFKADEDGVYSSGELTDEQINRFRVRTDVVRLIVTNVSYEDAASLPHIPPREMTEEEVHAAAMSDPDARPMTPEQLSTARRRPRPQLKK